MGLEVLARPASYLKHAPAGTIAQQVEHGRPIVATLRGDWCFSIVSVQDLRALSALSDLSPELLARCLRGAKTQAERKAVIRLLDWLAVRGSLGDGEGS